VSTRSNSYTGDCCRGDEQEVYWKNEEDKRRFSGYGVSVGTFSPTKQLILQSGAGNLQKQQRIKQSNPITYTIIQSTPLVIPLLVIRPTFGLKKFSLELNEIDSSNYPPFSRQLSVFLPRLHFLSVDHF
jgi:hypothetical protein